MTVTPLSIRAGVATNHFPWQIISPISLMPRNFKLLNLKTIGLDLYSILEKS